MSSLVLNLIHQGQETEYQLEIGRFFINVYGIRETISGTIHLLLAPVLLKKVLENFKKVPRSTTDQREPAEQAGRTRSNCTFSVAVMSY